MTKYSFILLSGEQDALVERLSETGVVDITRSSKPVDNVSGEIMAEIERLTSIRDSYGKAEKESLQARIDSVQKTIEDVKGWGRFDKERLEGLSLAGIPIHFHKLSKKSFREEWEEQFALSVISSDKGTVRFVVAGEDTLPGEVPSPKEDLKTLENTLSSLSGELKELEESIQEHLKTVPELDSRIQELYVKLDHYLASCAASPAVENIIVTMTGYSPSETRDSVEKVLKDADVFYLAEDAAVQDNPPIKFKNNRFVKMFEVLTDMYGRPEYDGFDPTPFIAVFFLLFFALCMGDAGYGLVLIIIGLLLKKVPSFKDMAPLVVTLGIGTVVVGFFLHTFFSIDIAKWEVFEPVKGIFLPDEIAGYAGGMVLAIVIGIFHLCLAMLVKAIQEVKTKGFAHSLGTVGWTLLIVGGVCIAGLALAGVLDKTATKWAVIVIGVISAIGIFPLNNLERSKLANVGLGLWDTYNTATGLLGDVLSYLRLYALGLAGGMLGMAFNDMGTMVLGDGSKPLMWVFFILLVLVGHTLNIAMCALGAFVHPLRLNFLEFFKNSGYEAGGRTYNPLKKNN